MILHHPIACDHGPQSDGANHASWWRIELLGLWALQSPHERCCPYFRVHKKWLSSSWLNIGLIHVLGVSHQRTEGGRAMHPEV
jgi:hypothetical protein